MSDTAQAIVGWTAFVVGGFTGQVWLMKLGAGIALSVGAKMLLDSGAQATEREESRQLNVMSNEASLGPIYGRTKVGVSIVDIGLHSSDNDILYVVCALALGSEDGSGIEAVEGIYFDDVLVIQDPVFEAEPSTSGLQGKHLGAGGLAYGLHRGSDAQTVDAELLSVFTKYSANTAGRGVAYIMLRLTWNPALYPTGLPNITAVVKGNRLYDPRSSSWAWSDSPALAILDYLTSKRYGVGALYAERDGGSLSEIDEQSFIDAANYHDDVITQGPGTGTRLTCNGAVDTVKFHETALPELLTSCRSELIWESGKFRLVTAQAVAAETFELTPDNIVGEVEYVRGGTDAVPNRVICHYVDDENEWLPQEVAWPEAGQVNAFLAADSGFENVLEISLPFTVGHYRAQQIGMVLLREAREDTGIVLAAKEEALKLRVDEVVRVTWPRAGFDQAEFRVKAIGLNPDYTVQLVLAEYDVGAYSLDAQDTRDTLPASSLPDPFSIAAPTNLVAVSGNATVQVTQGGSLVPRILLTWTPVDDLFLDHYEIQVKETATGAWRGKIVTPATAIPDDAEAYITGVVEGVSYDLQVRAINKLGVPSEWASVVHVVEVATIVPPVQNVTDVVQAFNGDFEGGLAYWGGPIDVSLEASIVNAGVFALKINKPSAAVVDAYQVADARDVQKDATADNYLYMRVQPGDEIRIRGFYRTATISARIGFREWDAGQASIGFQFESLGAVGAYTAFDATLTVGATTRYITLVGSTTTAATTGSVYFDDVTIERLVDAPSITDPLNLVAHSIIADTGTIGGWNLAPGELSSGSVKIQATAERILLGAATAPLTGVGIFIGKDGSDYEMRFGDPAGNYIHWDGAVLRIQGAIIESPGSGTSIGILGWSQDLTYSATDHNTVAWSSGTIRLQNGVSYSIVAGNTGDITARTYIFLDSAVSLTVLQKTTSPQNAVGANRILVAVADDSPSGTLATFIAFGTIAISPVINLGNQVSGTLTTAFAAAGLINANVTINADGTLTGAGGGQVSLNSLPGDIATAQIEALAITAAKVAASAVETDKLANLAVTGAKIAAATITAGKIVAGTITANEIAASAITTTQLAADSVTTAKVVAEAITGAKIAALTITAGLIAANAVTTAKVDALAITAAKIAASAIETDKLAANAVTAAKIAAGTITANEIAAATIVGDNLVANTLDAREIATLSMSGKSVLFDFGSIGGWTLAAGTLSSGSVTISATAERILMGAATAPLTGKGVFIGKDGTDYEFRAGDPAGDYIHFDGTTFTIKTNTFTGANPVFTGTVQVNSNQGTKRIHMREQGGSGLVEFFNGSGSLAGHILAGVGVSVVAAVGTDLALYGDGATAGRLVLEETGVDAIFSDMLVTISHSANAMLRLQHQSATGSPAIEFAQAGTSRSNIQHVDSNDVFTITSFYGPVQINGGSGGTPTLSALFYNDRVELAKKTLLVDGSASVPALAFVSDPDTGLYRNGANVLDIVAGGGVAIRAQTNGVIIFGTPASGDTALSVVVDVGAGDITKLVRVGAVDTAGAGFRALRVDN